MFCLAGLDLLHLEYNTPQISYWTGMMQGKLVKKDFNIAAEASGVLKPVTKVYNVTVTDNILEIRLHWAGRGTMTVPMKGAYGPLVSAISVVDPSELSPVLPFAFLMLGLHFIRSILTSLCMNIIQLPDNINALI